MNDLLLPTSLPLAKRRALRRRTSAGGTMFVVAMTLAVLSTIGAWALQSAALEVRMAGYERQNTQTHYLAEYGVMEAMQDVSPAAAAAVLNAATCGIATANGTKHAACLSIPCLDFTQSPVVSKCTEIGVVQPIAATCFRWEGASSMQLGIPLATSMSPIDGADGGVGGTPGSLGATTTVGDFSAEITEVADAPPGSGFSQANVPGSMGFYWGTVTSFGKTSTAGSSSSEGDEQLRARLLIGPITKIAFASCK